MELRDWLTIAALLIGPILAVQVSERLSKRKEEKNRKIELFQKLMSTRATRLNPIHVEALNMIDLTFYGDRPVIDAWRLYLDQLTQDPEVEGWGQKCLDLMNDLLLIMSKSVGFEIDPLTIKKVWYFPKAHGQTENEWNEIRKTLLVLLQQVQQKGLDKLGLEETKGEPKKILEIKGPEL